MFYVLSKVLFFFVAPAHFSLLLLLGGAIALAFSDRQKLGKWLVGLGLAALLVFGFSPLGSVIVHPLEQRFPSTTDIAAGNYAGIILLGGFEDPRISNGRATMALRASGDRLTETIRLANQLPTAKVIFTGGTAPLLRQGKSAAAEVSRFFAAIGIAESRIVIESRSRNTWENALFTRAILKPKPGQRYLLVTSAWHMPRAIGVFRKSGFDVAPWPADYRTAGTEDL